jgi:ribosomal protein L29
LKDASAVEHSGNVDINKMSDEELNNKLLALLNESPVAE